MQAAGQVSDGVRAQGSRPPRAASATSTSGPPPPERVKEQRIDVRLGGGRTGTQGPHDRAAGAARADRPVRRRDLVRRAGRRPRPQRRRQEPLPPAARRRHDGRARRRGPPRRPVVPGHFNQTHDHPELHGRTLLEHPRSGTTSSAVRPWACCAATSCRAAPSSCSRRCSGGQQARFQILLLELAGATLLLLDEPTDNLDLVSAEALEAGLAGFEGTVVAVTHDRWFLRSFDRFLVFDEDCSVSDLTGTAGPLPLNRPFHAAPACDRPRHGSLRGGRFPAACRRGRPGTGVEGGASEGVVDRGGGRAGADRGLRRG